MSLAAPLAPFLAFVIHLSLASGYLKAPSLKSQCCFQVRKAARDELRKGASQIKIMASGGVASPTDRLSNLQVSRKVGILA